MQRNSIILTSAILMATLPLTAFAAGMDATDSGAEAQMALAAQVPLAKAGALAQAAHPGTLVAIGFNDENGQGVYEATLVGSDGQPWLVKLDAASGQVLASGQAVLVGDEAQGEEAGNEAGNETGGETGNEAGAEDANG